jgi:hypothetical protein
VTKDAGEGDKSEGLHSKTAAAFPTPDCAAILLQNQQSDSQSCDIKPDVKTCEDVKPNSNVEGKKLNSEEVKTAIPDVVVKREPTSVPSTPLHFLPG